MSKNLKPKKVKGRVTVLRVIPYKECPVYIRFIADNIFMYDLIFKNEIYSSYLIINPEKGKVRLTKEQISAAGALILTGAMATIDTLLSGTVDKKTQEVVNTFEGAREKVEGKGVN